MPRFLVPGPWPEGDEIVLPGAASHHAMRVLRMRSGDGAEVFDGAGNRAVGVMSFSRDGAVLRVTDRPADAAEPPISLRLLQSMVSSEKLDFIVEKAVELGAASITIFPAERSVARLSGARLEKRAAKLAAVAASACEQCGRSRLPDVACLASLEDALRSVPGGDRFILAPGAGRGFLPGGSGGIAFAVGPEGGFSEEELRTAEDLGWKRASLGPRVLRTETAGLAALAAANAVAGDFRPS